MPPPRDHPPEEEPFAELLSRLEPRLQELFARYCVPPDEVERMVGDTLVVLGVRRAKVRDPEAWLLDALESRCRRRQEEESTAAEGKEN